MPSKKPENLDLQQRVLEIVNQPNYQPVKPKVLAKKLALSKDEFKELRKILRKMVKRGQLIWGASHVVRPAGTADASRVVVDRDSLFSTNDLCRPKNQKISIYNNACWKSSTGLTISR